MLCVHVLNTLVVINIVCITNLCVCAVYVCAAKVFFSGELEMHIYSKGPEHQEKSTNEEALDV